jgi:ribulose bisphosphate carboxylase small subunit
MRTLIREIVDIPECSSIDKLLESLAAIRASLPDPQDAYVRLRGDDVFGQRITITYSRPATAEEVQMRSSQWPLT